MIGELVANRYRVTRQIASGGMGVVCEAVHEGTGRKVALKIIRDVNALGGDKTEWLTRFRREARAVGALDTPHIIQVLDAGTDETTGQPFIAMELLQGADLSRLLKQLGPLPPPVVAKIVAQACLALERAHEAGVIHRDIKPGNVYLSAANNGEVIVKLGDFGIAKVISEEISGPENAELTQTGSLLGTPTYMSPEQAKGMKTIDHRADLWALAVVLYKALSNQVPYPKTEGLGQLIVSICTEPAPPIQSHAPWIAPEIAAILDRALQNDIKRRYQTAADFRAAIEEVIGPDRRIMADEIRALTPDERAFVAARHSSVFPPPPPGAVRKRRGSDTGEESHTQPGVVQIAAQTKPAPQRAPWIFAAVAGVLVLGGIAAYFELGRTSASADIATTLPPPIPSETASAPALPASDQGARTVLVEIVPPSASVEVDGKPVKVEAGKISIEGELGATRRVKLSLGGRDTSTEVAITRSGAMPQKLALETQLTTPSRPTARQSQPAPTTRVATPNAPKPSTKDSTKPGTSKGVGVVSEFE